MCLKRSLWYKFIALVLALVVMLPILAACGGSEEEKPTTPSPTATPTTTSTATTMVTATPTVTTITTATPSPDKGPVKIGAIYPTSGPFAAAGLLYDPIVSLVEWQVKNQGGILGGREVKFIKGDDRGVVAEAVGQAKKLILEQKVSILTFGGISAASFAAVADVAEELKVPYVALAALSNIATRKYCADAMSWEASIDSYWSHMEFLNPKKIAHLSYDLVDTHKSFDGFEGVVGLAERMKAAGMDLVYDEYYPVETVDFSPYISKIKYLNPDLLFAGANNPGNLISLLKQIMELGGLGNTRIYFSTTLNTSVINRPEAVGTYYAATYIPGNDDPGMKAFEDAFMQKYGKLPDVQTAHGYNCFWIAIKAIELAGTVDPEKVAQALRSGNLELEGAFGHLRIGSNGGGVAQYPLAQVQEGGKLVKVWPQ